MNSRRKLILLSTMLMIGHTLRGQDLSGKQVSIQFDKASTHQALEQINALDNIKLAYNPDVIPSGNSLTRVYTNAAVESVLDDILGKQFSYKYRGSYILIQPNRIEETKKKNFTFTGEVRDAKTGEILEDVTVYEVNNFESTLTDDRGNFELNVSSKTDYITIAISREAYLDTLIQVKSTEEMEQTLVLRPKAKGLVQDVARGMRYLGSETERLVELFAGREARENVKNVLMEEFEDFQFSVVPMIGTNGKMSGKITNQYSLNLIVGYSQGLDGVELGVFII